MALSPITPRDRVQQLVDIARKTWRYWWLIAVFAVAGGVLSLAFALTRPRDYLSWVTLFYQERIQSALLTPNREDASQRGIGDRYRELILARSQLSQILDDPTLDPFPEERDPEVKLEKLRLAVRFASRGAGVFRIEYKDRDPERAKRVVEKLTRLLQEKEETLRNEQAAATVAFATEQSVAAKVELEKREKALAQFLAKYPEFALEAPGMGGPDLARAPRTPKATTNPRLSVKERQLERIRARLDAPPNAPPVSVVLPATPERVAAEAQVADANRELSSAQRELDDALSKFTERHPSAIKAQDRVNSARDRLRRAQAAMPPQVETIVQPATPEDRKKLEREAAALEAEIRDEQSRTGRATPASDTTTNRVVQLETENSTLRRDVTEQRSRVQSLADSVFRATMDANQKLAEQGGRLSIVDPPFKPMRPTGAGKTIFLLAGMILFVTLGLSLAIALAVIDDRLYRRQDVDHLGLPVLAVIPPAKLVKSRAGPKGKSTKTTKPIDRRSSTGGVT